MNRELALALVSLTLACGGAGCRCGMVIKHGGTGGVGRVHVRAGGTLTGSSNPRASTK